MSELDRLINLLKASEVPIEVDALLKPKKMKGCLRAESLKVHGSSTTMTVFEFEDQDSLESAIEEVDHETDNTKMVQRLCRNGTSLLVLHHPKDAIDSIKGATDRILSAFAGLEE